jgi:hypothetical protein
MVSKEKLFRGRYFDTRDILWSSSSQMNHHTRIFLNFPDSKKQVYSFDPEIDSYDLHTNRNNR